MARERVENENTVKALKSKVKVSERVAERIEREWKSKMEEIIVQANTERMKSTKVLNPRRCIMRVYTREIRMRVHENTHKWPTVRMAVQRRECWISATERFQRKPHKCFDLRCPLST